MPSYSLDALPTPATHPPLDATVVHASPADTPTLTVPADAGSAV